VTLAGAGIVGLGVEVNVGYLTATALDLAGRTVLSRRVSTESGRELESLRALTSQCWAQLVQQGADVVGVDWRTPLSVARERTGGRVALQGNLDPVACLAPWPAIEEKVHEVLADNGGHPGHVFNLGHGVTPDLDPEVLGRIVELVHQT